MRHLGGEFGLVIPLISRKEWGAEKPKKRDTLWTPIPYVRLTTTDSLPLTTTQECIKEVKKLQERFMKHFNKPDIPWNFMVGSDGMVYKGRGWYVEPDRHKDWDWLKGKCVDIALIGNFQDVDPPWEMMKTTIELIQYGVFMNILYATMKIIPFRDRKLIIDTNI